MKYLIGLFVFVGFLSFVPLSALFVQPPVVDAQGVISPEIGAGTFTSDGSTRVDTFGDAGGLVTCDGVSIQGKGVPCDFCKAVLMVHRITEFLVAILVLISVIMLVITGIQMAYIASGSGDARQILKDRLTNIVIGFFLIVASWTIIDTLLKALVSDGEIRDNWKEPIERLCGFQETPAISDDPDQAPDDAKKSSVTATGNLVEYAGAKFDSSVVDNVKSLAEEFDLRVSGGHRTPERNREVNGAPNSDHLTGKAADFVGTMTQMQAAADKARAQGARFVKIHNAGSGTHLHVSW